MIELEFFKAQRIRGNEPVEDVRISFLEETPNFLETREGFDTVRDRQAEELARTLWNVLPGGVVDALIAALMKRRASQLIVSMQPWPKEAGKMGKGNG